MWQTRDFHRLLASIFFLSFWTLTFSGCRQPLGPESSQQTLRQSVAEAIAREIQSAQADSSGPEPTGRTLQTTQPQSTVLDELAGRRDELDAIGPLGPGRVAALDLGPTLTGDVQGRVEITRQRAITSAVERNLGVQETRLQPRIAAEEVLAAEAIFDTVFFTTADLSKIDEPARVPVINGIPLGTPFSASETYRFETGVRKEFSPGTEVFVSTDLTRFRNAAPGISFSPDPAYTGAVNLGVNQPLLRGFGSDVNTATIRISENQERRSTAEYHAELLAIATDAERTYWNLYFAWRELAIREWLLDVGIEVRDTLERRRELDVTSAEYADAVSRVEQRRAAVIRARRLVRRASDALKVQINDPELTVSSEIVLYPIDETIESPISYNLREAILTAIDERPEIRQAALDVDDARIRQQLARNDRLPLLDVSAQMSFFGLDDSPGGAYSEVSDIDFIDYLLGLTFEYPLGNNAADANFRAARLRRSAAALNYLRTVQEVILDVKAALRDVITNYELIQATRAFRVAQAENLRTLQVEEETLAGLTPEFLNLKFQRQETLAEARREEVLALVNFDIAVADLYRAMGIGLTMNKIDIEIIEEAGPVENIDDLRLGDGANR